MFSDLNEKQKEAVFTGDGPMLIVAGAGSGKTKTLTSRLAYLITKMNVLPSNILAITFTNKAAEEMKSRVFKIIKDNNIEIDSEPFVGTFHSFGASLLRKEAGFFGRSAGYSIYDSDDSLRVIKKIVKENNLDTKKYPPAKIQKQISRIKSELSLKQEIQKNEEDREMWFFFDSYEKALEKNNAFDFDDLLEKVVRLFQQHSEILEKYQKKYSRILIDEYQDVNTTQYWLVKLLASKHQNINAVGDDAQSIYAFRFSDFRNFLNFERDWPNAKVVFLEQNYRSSKKIIEASSELILRNINQKQKNLWTSNDDGAPVHVYEQDNEFTEADFVVSKCVEYIKKGESVGILYRTNAQSRALEQIFLEYGMDYNLFGALSFYERKEIKDIVSALRYSYNPKDEVSLERLKKNLYKGPYLILKEGLSLQSQKFPKDIIEYFLKTADYLNEVKKEPNFLDRLENIKELIYFSSQFNNLGEFLEKISLASPLDYKQTKREQKKHLSGANLMTIHLAKGLEFDIVFVVGVNEGILPHERSFSKEENLEEERRLMYVAMTRARKELYLSFWQVPSRFLYEISADKVEFFGERSLDDEERYIEYD